ncbi:MAG: hypothetical protein ABW133_24580, partial [Polyangiaceae bacterium]
MSRARLGQQRFVWLGAMFFCAASALSPTSAEGAARRGASPVRRTASAPSNETNDVSPRARRSNDSPRGVRAEKRGAKATPSPEGAPSASNSKAPLDGRVTADGKSLSDPKLADPKPASDGARSVDPRSESRGNADARGAVKAPSDLPAPQKSTGEKFGAEVGSSARDRGVSDSAEAPRSNGDASRNAAQGAAPPPNGSSASASATLAPGATTASLRPAIVTLDEPVFDGGDVPKAAASLERMKAGFARCASIENALTKNEASIDLRFLVRAPGKAEGVGAEKVRGVSGDVVRCMTSVLAR